MAKILDGTPIDPKPIESTQEELDIAEMSAKAKTKIDVDQAVSVDDVATIAIPKGIEISVTQSVRNAGSVTVHLDQKLSRLYGQSKTWTDAKIYQQFAKQYTPVIQAWEEMCNVLAITEIPEDIKPIEQIKP